LVGQATSDDRKKAITTAKTWPVPRSTDSGTVSPDRRTEFLGRFDQATVPNGPIECFNIRHHGLPAKINNNRHGSEPTDPADCGESVVADVDSHGLYGAASATAPHSTFECNWSGISNR